MIRYGKLIVVMSSMVLLPVQLSAQNLMSFSLNTGEVVEGYVSSQIPGKSINIKGTNANGISVERNGLKWSDVVSINIKPRRPEDLSGTNREYTLTSGTIITGEYIREIPGRSITLKLEDGNERFFSISDVKRMLIKGFNNEQTLKEQYWLKDIIVTKDDNEYVGYIIEQNMTSKNPADYYIVLSDISGNNRQIKTSEIKMYRKQENSDVRKFLVDKILDDGICEINDHTVKFFDMNETNEGILLLPDSLASDMVYKCGKSTEIVLYCNNGKENYSYSIIPITKFDIKEGKRTNIKYGCSHKAVWHDCIEPSDKTLSRNNTTTVMFKGLNVGTYILFNRSTGKAVKLDIN